MPITGHCHSTGSRALRVGLGIIDKSSGKFYFIYSPRTHAGMWGWTGSSTSLQAGRALSTPPSPTPSTYIPTTYTNILRNLFTNCIAIPHLMCHSPPPSVSLPSFTHSLTHSPTCCLHGPQKLTHGPQRVANKSQ